MRMITLNTAAIDNSGQRHEAGVQIKVGNGKAEISAMRAEQLLVRGLCAELSADDDSAQPIQAD